MGEGEIKKINGYGKRRRRKNEEKIERGVLLIHEDFWFDLCSCIIQLFIPQRKY